MESLITKLDDKTPLLPDEFCVRNNWDPMAYEILRHLAGWRAHVHDGSTGRLLAQLSLDLALKFTERRERFEHTFLGPRQDVTMGQFIEEHDILPMDQSALRALEAFVNAGNPVEFFDTCVLLKRLIRGLIHWVESNA